MMKVITYANRTNDKGHWIVPHEQGPRFMYID